MRDDSADTNPFLNWTTLNSYCVVGMDLDYRKGAFADKIKFTVLVRYIHKNTIVDSIFVVATMTINFEEKVVHECLAVAGESKNFCE